MHTKYAFQPKIKPLEMAHTNFCSSFRKRAYQTLIRTKLTKPCFRHIKTNNNKELYFQSFQNYTLKYVHKYSKLH